MSIEQTRICHRCQREIQREDKFCPQCGADLDGLKDDKQLISAGLTIAPFIIIPILLMWAYSIGENKYYVSFGLAYVGVAVFIAMLLAMCAAGLAIVSWVVRRRNRTVARGILKGILAGLLLGIGSCTGSVAVFS